MTYDYDLRLDDFIAAQNLHIRRTTRAKFSFVVWQRIMPFMSVICIVLLIRDTVFHHFSYPSWLGGLLSGVGFFGLYCVIVRPFLIKKTFRAIGPDIKGDAHPVNLEFIDDQLVSRIPGRSEARFQRAAIVRFEEDEKIALLYLGRKKFLFIPKRAMPLEGWNHLRQWIGTDGC